MVVKSSSPESESLVQQKRKISITKTNFLTDVISPSINSRLYSIYEGILIN